MYPVMTPFPGIKKGEIFVNVKDYGAVGDGVTDDRTAIIAALEFAKANLPAVVVFPPRDYAITNGITLELAVDTGGLTIYGYGARLIHTAMVHDGYAFALRIWPGTSGGYMHDVAIYGLGVYDPDPVAHNNPAYDETHGINIWYCKNAIVSGCHIEGVGDQGIEFEYVIGGVICNNELVNVTALELEDGAAISIKDGCQYVKVYGNAVRDLMSTGSSGIAVKIITANEVTDILVYGNTIDNIPNTNHGGLFLSPSGAAARRIVFKNNIVRNCKKGVAHEGGNALDCVIRGNIIESADYGIYSVVGAASLAGLVIEGNQIRNINPQSGIYVKANNLQIVNNVIENTYRRGIIIQDSDDVVIRGGRLKNTGTGVAVFAIEFTNCTNRRVEGATIDTPGAQAIWAADSVDNCDVFGTGLINACVEVVQITNCRLSGRILSLPSGGVVTSCRIILSTNENAAAIKLLTAAINAVITGNYIQTTGDTAIQNGTDYNTVVGNNYRNSGGISLNGANNVVASNIGP